MRETNKNNLPIPVCFFFPTGKSWTTPNSASYISYVQRRFCLAPLLEGLWVSRSFDGKDSLAAKLDTRQSTAPKNKKKCPLKINGCIFFRLKLSFFWGEQETFVFFCLWGCIPWSLKFLSQKACWKRKKLNGWTMTFLRVAGVVEGAVLTPPGERGKSTQSSIVAAECTWFCQTNLWQLCYASIEEVVS